MSRSRLLLLVTVAVGVAVRIVAIEADPPPWHQLGFLSDEGWWAHNARNRALFGSFVVTEPRDEFNQGLVLSPVFTLLCFGSFALLGPSLQSLRLVSALMAGLTALSLAVAARRTLGEEASWQAAMLYLFAPFTWVFGRVGLVEETMNAFLALCLALWLGARRGSWVLSGLAHAAAFGTKSLAAVMGVGLLAMDAFGDDDGRRWRRLPSYGVGLLSGLAIWASLVYLPYREDYRELSLKVSQDNAPRSLAGALRNTADTLLQFPSGRPGVTPWLRYAPIQAILMIIALGAAPLRPSCLRREPLLLFGVPVLLVNMALLAPMQHKPDRRYMALMIPEVLLCCWGVRRASGVEADGASVPRRLLSALPLALCAATPVAALARSRNEAAAAFVVASALGEGVLGFCWGAVWPRIRGLTQWPVVLTLLVFVGVVANEASRISFSLARESEALSSIVGDGMVLGGAADTLLLPSRAMTFNDMRRASGGRFNGDIARRAPIGWLVTWTQPERPSIVENMEAFGPAVKVRETPLLPLPGGGHRASVALWRREAR